VHPDGKFGWVQGVNDKPDVVAYEDSQLYGVGAFLLAGSQMHDLTSKNY
jgi:unsaturated rhamnogalacturonyl hydrolase